MARGRRWPAIVGKLYRRGLYEDACEFPLGCVDLYPEAEYGYYAEYLIARSYDALERSDLAREHCETSASLNPDFASAAGFLAELSAVAVGDR